MPRIPESGVLKLWSTVGGSNGDGGVAPRVVSSSFPTSGGNRHLSLLKCVDRLNYNISPGGSPFHPQLIAYQPDFGLLAWITHENLIKVTWKESDWNLKLKALSNCNLTELSFCPTSLITDKETGSRSVVLGAIDEMGNAFFYAIEPDKKKYWLFLELSMEGPSSHVRATPHHRIIWSSFRQDDEHEDDLEEEQDFVALVQNSVVYVIKLGIVLESNQGVKKLRIGELTSGIMDIVDHKDIVTCAAINPYGQLIVTASLDGSVVFTDLEHFCEPGNRERKIPPWTPHEGKPVHYLAFTVETFEFAITGSSFNSTIKIWDMAQTNYQLLQEIRFTPLGHKLPTLKPTFDPVKKLLTLSNINDKSLYLCHMGYVNGKKPVVDTIEEFVLDSPVMSSAIVSYENGLLVLSVLHDLCVGNYEIPTYLSNNNNNDVKPTLNRSLSHPVVSASNLNFSPKITTTSPASISSNSHFRPIKTETPEVDLEPFYSPKQSLNNSFEVKKELNSSFDDEIGQINRNYVDRMNNNYSDGVFYEINKLRKEFEIMKDLKCELNRVFTKVSEIDEKMNKKFELLRNEIKDDYKKINDFVAELINQEEIPEVVEPAREEIIKDIQTAGNVNKLVEYVNNEEVVNVINSEMIESGKMGVKTLITLCLKLSDNLRHQTEDRYELLLAAIVTLDLDKLKNVRPEFTQVIDERIDEFLRDNPEKKRSFNIIKRILTK